MGVQSLVETRFVSKINGSRPSDGAQWTTGDQIIHKTSRNFISEVVSHFLSILGVIEVESDLKFTRFTIVHILD